MSARIYTPTTDGTCAVCGRPQVEHSRGAWSSACPPAEVTADNLTDEQIGKLRRDLSGEITNNQITLGSRAEDINRSLHEIRHDCLIAWGHRRSPAPGGKQAAKARVASAINARAKAKAVQPIDATAESLGDIDFMDFSSKLRTEMDHLDSADWQAAEDLRQDCRIARVYNNADARKRVAAAINARNTKT